MDRAARAAGPWVVGLARAGYAAKGAVYVLVGGLAAAAALKGGSAEGSSGALAALSGSTAGSVLLAAIAAGLVGYALWSLVRALLGPEGESGWKRAYRLLSAIVHGGLAAEAASLALGSGSGGGDSESAAHWSATLMAQPFGRWLLAGVAVAIVAFGLQQLWNAWRADLDERLALGELSRAARVWVVRIGRAGLAARGAVFVLIGVFVGVAALETDPSEARGIEGALDALRQDSRWLLLAVAVGFVAYGIYNGVRARYRLIRPV